MRCGALLGACLGLSLGCHGGAPVAPPQIDAVTPPQAPTSGAALTLRGADLQPGVRVRVGGLPAQATWRSATEVAVTAPAHPGAIGAALIEVENPDGQRAARGDLFRYTASLLRFAAPTRVDTGDGPNSVAAADLDGDGRVDLVAADYGAGAIDVFLGQPSGLGKGTRTALPADIGPLMVAITDMNRDGKPDLVLPFYYGKGVFALQGQGDGTFAPPARLGPELSGAAGNLAIGDFNGDGTPDVAVRTYTPSGLTVLLSGPGGAFTAQPVTVPVSPLWSAVGDFNEDGRADLVLVNPARNQISVLLGKGDGGFLPAVDWPSTSAPCAVAVADLDGDRHADLIVSNYGDDSVSVLPGRGDGSFGTRRDYPGVPYPRQIAVADLNADGAPDLAVAQPRVMGLSVLLSQGGGALAPAMAFPMGELAPDSLAAADIDRDGLPDLVFPHYAGNAVVVLRDAAQ